MKFKLEMLLLTELWDMYTIFGIKVFTYWSQFGEES